MFCAPGHVWGCNEGVGFRFHVLHARTPFGRYRDSILAEVRAPGPVFMFCAPGLVFGETEGAGFRFNLLRSRTCFRSYGGRWVPFACFALPESFLAILRASCAIFMFCALGHILGGTVGAKSRFQVFRSRTRLGPYRGRRIPFSSFVLPDLFSTVPRALGPIFMFCAPGLVLCRTEYGGSYIHVFSSQIFFRQYRGRRVLFSCYAHPDSFWAVLRASGPVFMFCTLRLIFDGTEGVGPRCHVLRCRTHFRWYRGRQVQFSFFALLGSFWAVARVLGPVFMFCALRLVFDGTVGVGYRFHVLRSRTHLGRYQVRRVPISWNALPDLISAELREHVSIFMFCAPRIVWGGTEGVRSSFHGLHS
jgi:hypothetical protein